MLHATNFPWRMPPGVLPGLVGEHGEQAAIARVKVQVILIRLAKVGLFEEERHAQHALPEIYRALPGGSYNCDVVNALHLCRFHAFTPRKIRSRNTFLLIRAELRCELFLHDS